MTTVQQRAVLSNVRAYYTVSFDAVIVIVGLPPIELLSSERQAAFEAHCAVEDTHEPRDPDEGDLLHPSASHLRTRTTVRWSRRVDNGHACLESG